MRANLLFFGAKFLLAIFSQLAELTIIFACAGCLKHALVIGFWPAVASRNDRGGSERKKCGAKRVAKCGTHEFTFVQELVPSGRWQVGSTADSTDVRQGTANAASGLMG